MNGTTIAGVTGQSGISSTKLNQPYSVALDSQLNLYVADTGNNRIQTFLRY
jgi:DNA-binding beta-propeller fold protein YncE